MKKQLLTLLAIFMTTIVFGQKINNFVITPKGFINSSDSTKDYIVIDFPNKTKSELYKKSLIYLSGLVSNPKNSISEVENESLTFQFAIDYPVFGGPDYNVNVTFRYLFKDGAVKIDQPNLNKISYYNTTRSSSGLYTVTINPDNSSNNRSLYKRNGSDELRGKEGIKGKANLENLINSLNRLYFEKISKEENW